MLFLDVLRGSTLSTESVLTMQLAYLVDVRPGSLSVLFLIKSSSKGQILIYNYHLSEVSLLSGVTKAQLLEGEIMRP